MITTEEAERLAERVEDEGGLSIVAAALRSLAAERDALRADLKAQFERAELTDVLHKQHVTKLEAENARLREVLGQINEQSIETFCINPEGGANIVVDGHERFAFESDVMMLLNIARAALGEKDNGKA
jgi:hypothetical protein